MTPAMWPWALGAVVAAALVIVIFLIVLLKKASKVTQFVDAPEPEAPPKEEEEEPKEIELAGGVRSVFRRASRLLRRVGKDGEDIPLYLLIGNEGSRDAEMLARAGLEMPFGKPADERLALGRGCGFWFFDHGAVLDVAGEHVIDQRRWRTVLRLLQRMRPHRPLDGVIITLSCGELLGAVGDDNARTDVVANAAKLYRRLSEAQQQLGLRLPAYVLLTDGERLKGFGSFCGGLTSAARQEIVGWSSPYSADTAYRGEWVTEAVNALAKRLDELQMEMFTDGTKEPDLLLRFPRAVRSLAEPLRAATDALLKSSAYQESLFLRGIYLSGWTSAEGGADGMTAFVGDLLGRKIFAETGLATPTARTAFATNRAVRIAQIAAAVSFLFFGSGLFFAWRKFERQNEMLTRFLSGTAANMEASSRVAHDAIADATLQSWASDLLDGMGTISFRRYGSLFVPSSWFSPFEDQLTDAITESFNRIILESIRLQMEEKARALYTAPSMQLVTATQAGTVTESAGALVPGQQRMLPLEQMPEFVSLQRYVDEMTTLEAQAQVFNNVRNRGDLKGLGGVVAYALGKQLPERFYQKADLYRRALERSTYKPYDAGAVASQATWHAEELTAELYRAMYERNAFAARLEQLSSMLQQASWQWPVAGEADRFTELRARFKDVETQLAGPELVWAFRPVFSLGAAYDTTLAKMDRSLFFGPAVTKKAREAGFAGWAQFRRNLAAVQSPLTGTLLSTRNGEAEMRLSSDSVLLQSALDTFLSQGFVASAPVPGHIRTTLPASTRQAWDPALVEQAAGVAHAYDRFKEKTLERFPAELRLSIDQVSRERANAQMVDLLSQGQRFESLPPAAATEDDLRAGVAAFSATLPAVSDAMDGFARLGFNDSRRDLAAAESAEALRLLHIADALLEVDQPYRPRQGSFSWWDGNGAPSPAAWGVRDAADVAAYLDTTRTRVSSISRNYAQPLLAWFAKAGTSNAEVKQLAPKWQSILDDLRDYDAKKPGNSLALLEDYAGAQMGKIATTDCGAATLPASVRPTRGYFNLALQNLSKQLSSRCYLIAGKDAAARYTELARYFNQRLAGRYPFAEAAPRAGEPEADPEDLRAFYKMYDASQGVIRSMPGDGVAPAFLSARQFMSDMGSVRSFFAPFLDARKAETAPSFDLETTFRVLREREVDGSEIIGWSLSVGDDTVTNRDKKKKLRWMPGQPLRLSLRWAADSPRIPVLPSATRGAVVHDRSVVFEYTNRWSLLTALADHLAATDELPSYADVEPVTLAFAVYTQPADGGTPAPKPSQVFARVAVLAPGTTQTLDVPRFPSHAPRLEGPILAEDTP